MQIRRFVFCALVTITTCPIIAHSQVEHPAHLGGRRLMRRVVEFFGGEENLSGVKSVQERLSERVYTSQSQLVTSADTVRIIQFPDNVQYTVINRGISKTLGPSGAFGVNHGKVFDLSSQKTEMLDDVKRDIVNIAQHVNDHKYVFRHVGEGKVGTVAASIIDIDADGAKTRWWIDAESGKLLFTSEDFNDSLLGTGRIHLTLEYSKYKKFGDLNLPDKAVIREEFDHAYSDGLDRALGHLGGNVGVNYVGVAELTIEKINPTIPKNAFDKPTK